MTAAAPPDLITIASGALTVRINPLGAELWSILDRAGGEWMTGADPAFWTGHAPLLFPIVGALAGGRYRTGGHDYAMAKHGFARTSRFRIAAARADEAVMVLEDSAGTRAIYPFAFRLELGFRLDGACLSVTASLHNPAQTPLPFSFGFHPAFAWPLPGGAAKEDHRVVFERPEPAPIRRIDPPSGLLLPEPRPSPVVGDTLHPTAALFVPDALIWDRLASRALRFGAPGGGWIALDFPDTPMLGIWQKPGAAYLCLEPWQGIADPQGFCGEFAEKPGVVTLAGGATAVFRMTIGVEPAA